MAYQYYECEEGESQYDSVDISTGQPVDARYIPARMEVDSGNSYIEALPPPRTQEEIISVYSRSIPGYSREKLREMSTYDKMLEVDLLRIMRVPLPYQKDFEFCLYTSLLTTYRARHQQDAKGQNITYISQGQEIELSAILVGDSSASTDAACSVIGYSGCGKTSTVHITVSHYPQYIIHQDGDGGRLPQITYLVVDCAPNSNFNALYEEIGREIDQALGNVVPVYFSEIKRQKNLKDKFWKVVELIEKLAIGAIILDEIQLIDFEHTKENSFNALMVLSNITKVSIIVVGTEEARDKMFSRLQNCRRTGMQINGNAYCKNREYFGLMVREVFKYQWFDEEVIPDEDIIDTLYDLTKGIIDLLIEIYSSVNYEYLKRNKKPKVDSDFIRKVANKYYPEMQKALVSLGTPEADAQIKNCKDYAEAMAQKIKDDERQKEEAARIIASKDDSDHESVMLRNVSENIKGMGFTYSQIEDTFKKIWKKPGSKKLSESDLTKKVAALLLEIDQNTTPKKRSAHKTETPQMDTTQMKDFLFANDKEKENDHTCG